MVAGWPRDGRGMVAGWSRAGRGLVAGWLRTSLAGDNDRADRLYKAEVVVGGLTLSHSEDALTLLPPR